MHPLRSRRLPADSEYGDRGALALVAEVGEIGPCLGGADRAELRRRTADRDLHRELDRRDPKPPASAEAVPRNGDGEPGRDDATAPSDPLPEDTNFKDDGCEAAPACLQCSLPLCRYDLPGGLRAARNLARDLEIERMRNVGWNTAEIATAHGISKRRVEQVLQRARASRRDGPDRRAR